MTLEVTFVDCESKEFIDNVTGYTISGEDSTLTVNLENGSPIVFNYDYVFSVRYVDRPNKKECDSDATIDEELFEKLLRRILDGAI